MRFRFLSSAAGRAVEQDGETLCRSTNPVEPAAEPEDEPLCEPEPDRKAGLRVGNRDGRSVESLLARISSAKRKFKIPRQD